MQSGNEYQDQSRKKTLKTIKIEKNWIRFAVKVYHFYYFWFCVIWRQLKINNVAIQNSVHFSGKCPYSWAKTRGKSLYQASKHACFVLIDNFKCMWKVCYSCERSVIYYTCLTLSWRRLLSYRNQSIDFWR